MIVGGHNFSFSANQVFFYLFLFGCSISGMAQGFNEFPQRNFYDEIPYEFVRGKILIPVTINDSTYKFIFDTGGLFIVSSRVIKEQDFKQMNTMSVNGMNNLSARFDVYQIPKTQINELKYKNFNAIHIDLLNQILGACLQADGLIGRDF